MQSKRFHAAVLNAYRTATDKHFQVSHERGDVFSDADVIYRFSLISPINILRNARIQLLCRVLAKQPRAVLPLVLSSFDCDTGWSAAIVSDFRFIAHTLPQIFQGTNREVLSNIIDTGPKSVSKSVKKFFCSPYANLDIGHSTAPNPISLAIFPCPDCAKVFNTYQKVSLHRFKAHGVKNDLRCYFRDTHCTACMLEFFTRPRLFNHLAYRSKVCRAHLYLRGPVISQDDADALDVVAAKDAVKLYAKGYRRHKAVVNAIRLPGPLEPVIALCPSSHHQLGFGRNIY